MEDAKKPVWSVYDLYRDARLNVKYYSARLHSIERLNFLFEFVLLATAPSSAVASLWFWSTDLGSFVWKGFGAVAAFIAILKPCLGLTQKIKSFEQVLSGYRALEHDVREIIESIKIKGKYDKEVQSDFRKSLKKNGVLVNKNPETVIHKKLKNQCEVEVLEELPENKFFVPD